MANSTIVPYERLLDFTISVFRKLGCPDHDARTAAITLISADLRGVDSHGVARLTGYVRLKEAGRANPAPQLRVVHETPSTAVVDGDSPQTGAVAPDELVELPVAGRGGVPDDASTVVLNVTAVEAAGAGHLRVWDCDDELPLASNLNFARGATVADTVVAGVSEAGTVCLYVGGSATDLVVDVEGALV